jgi:serine-type D-Ala-D-Ala carboxypeptidase/endopeptidase (penicillin-binding protein 4)
MTRTSGKLVLALLATLLLASPLVPQQKTSPPAGTPAGPAVAPAPAQSVEATAAGGTLEARLNPLVHGAIARGSTSSIKIVEVESGRVIADRNGNQPVIPASNMKLFTTAAAFELLEDDFQFVTTVSMRGELDRSGNLQGDLKFTGRGDPTIGGRFHDGDANTVFEGWARQLRASGIRNITGDLIFEHGYFDQQWVHPSWPRDQLVSWYQAPIAALSLQEGTVMVRVIPTQAGQLARVEFNPANSYVSPQNSAVTRSGSGPLVTRRLGTNNIIIGGSAPPQMGPSEIFVTVENPVHYFASVVRTTFERNGIRVGGQMRLAAQEDGAGWNPIIVHSTPLEIVTYVINKKSQNHYAEQLLKAVGAETRQDGSFEGGGAAIKEWLVAQLGVAPGEFVQADGSGMSRENQASADAFIRVLRHMWTTPHRNDFVASMPYSGEVDSRLRRRMNEQAYARRVFAKTGYLSGAIGLSGYVRGESGRIYAFSFLFNRYATGVWGVYRLQDEMLKEIIRHG